MNFLSELIEKKRNLKTVETLVTNILGEKVIEKKDINGLVLTQKVCHAGLGFIVDDKPDFQVAQVLDYLFFGSQDPLLDSGLLKNYGITHVLSIGVNVLPLQNFICKKVELLDIPEANLIDALKLSIEFIDTVHKQNLNHKIFVHCNAGYSRSPAIVIGYLMKAKNYSFSESLALVNKTRRVKPNDGFIKQLKNFGN